MEESSPRTDNPQNSSGEAQIITQVSSSFSGPLPPPEVLAQFDRVVPGAAERIIAMAEKQADHRRGLEKKITESDISDSRLGLIFGFLIGLIGVGGGVMTAILGRPGTGSVISITALASLVGVFVYGSSQNRSEKEGKGK